MGSLTWTDERLRTAVADSRSWKEATRRLGLAPSGYVRIRRRAGQLGIPTDHFTGKRRWSDADLRNVLGECSSWPELLDRLDVSYCTENRLYVKGRAARLGLDLSRLNGFERPSAVACTSDAPDLKRYLRVAAESLAVAWFMLRGIEVAVPTKQCEYDLVATLDGEIKRVQVKSSAYRARQGTWKVEVGRRPYVLDKKASKAPYDPDLIDFYFIVDGDGCLYLIPSQVLAGRTSINIGPYSEFKIGDASSLFGVMA